MSDVPPNKKYRNLHIVFDRVVPSLGRNVWAALQCRANGKQFHSPPPAHVTLYLGHKNREAPNANRRHYSTKCSPAFRFFSVPIDYFGGFFYNYFLFMEDISLSSKIKLTDKVWGSCASLKARGAEGEQKAFAIIIRGSNMKFFDLDWFGGTLKWGHWDYRGRLVSKWLWDE